MKWSVVSKESKSKDQKEIQRRKARDKLVDQDLLKGHKQGVQIFSVEVSLETQLPSQSAPTILVYQVSLMFV